MSNHLAVAAVTATLVQLLEEAVTRDFPGGHALALRPDAPLAEGEAEVRVFLYRVEPNGTRRNDDLPTRSGDGSAVQRPQAALTLDYLLSFVGEERDFAPHRLLGIAATTLHAHPILTRTEVERMILGLVPGDPLALSDLAEAPESVRITPLTLTLDELSTMWSSFPQTAYRLSAAYRAEVVLLSPSVSPARPLPVRERRLAASSILRPSVRRAVSTAGPLEPIVAGGAVLLEGTDLRGDVTLVRFGATRVSPTTASAFRVEAPIPAGVRAGAVALAVEHQRSMGEPPVLRPAGQSNVVPVIVRPRISQDGTGYRVHVRAGSTEGPPGVHTGVIDVSVEPPVGDTQPVELLLSALDGTGTGFSFAGERRDSAGPPTETADLSIPFAGVPAGEYLVRVVVSGAESPLDTAAGTGAYSAPAVTVP